MILGALPGLGAVALALTASAPPLAPAPLPVPQPVVSRAAAFTAPVVSRAPARTVPDAIDRAEALGAISRRRAQEYRAEWIDAFRAMRRLTGPRRALVQQAVSSTQTLAGAGALRAGRLAPAIAAARASAVLARSDRPLPAPGVRFSVPGDTAVYSYRPPYGLQFHPLGTAGKLNALASTCNGRAKKRGWRCRRNGLRKAADRLVELSVPAGKTLRFEYLFAFGGGRPGWVSAMTQATGAQALARASALTGRRRYATAARAAYRTLTTPVPRGTGVFGPDGRVAHLAMYSFRPRLRVLNGEEQSLIGLADYARITRDRPAARLARRGARELALRLPAFDTGAWTLYNLGGAEADMNYHRLAAQFARGVCTRGLAHSFCPVARRFARYTTEAPRLWLSAPPQARAPRRVAIAIGASKQTFAHLVVRDGRGRVVLDRSLALGRFGARIVLPVRHAGRHTMTLGARAINGRAARRTATLTATPPPPKPKPKPQPKPTPKPKPKKAPQQPGPVKPKKTTDGALSVDGATAKHPDAHRRTGTSSGAGS